VIKLNRHIQIALGYFLLAASLGVLLRSFYAIKIPLNYDYIVHTHSHIALLGWVYLVLTTLIFKIYARKIDKYKEYRAIFWFTQLTLVGMLLTFPFQGYAVFSIIFSTLFLFASYWFTWFIMKNVPRELRTTNYYKCINAALWYMVFSSIGPWMLGAIMASLGQESIWYRMSIYFYLHFQYNGWMIMALLGLFFYVLEQHRIIISNVQFKRFFWSINLGILLTFFLSTLWTKPNIIFNVLGGVGDVFQILSFVILLEIVVKSRIKLTDIFSRFQYQLLKTVALMLGIKMMLQLLTSLPYYANLAATYLDFTVGYLHWTFLGVMSIGLFLLLDFFKLIYLSKISYMLYLIGFAITEVLIFYKGIAAWQGFSMFDGYFETLAIGSFFIPLALILMLLFNMKSKTKD